MLKTIREIKWTSINVSHSAGRIWMTIFYSHLKVQPYHKPRKSSTSTKSQTQSYIEWARINLHSEYQTTSWFVSLFYSISAMYVTVSYLSPTVFHLIEWFCISLWLHDEIMKYCCYWRYFCFINILITYQYIGNVNENRANEMWFIVELFSTLIKCVIKAHKD